MGKLLADNQFTRRPPKLFTKTDGKVSFHPKSVNSDETTFRSKFLIYYTKVRSSMVYIHDATEIPPFPLLFFGGDISVQRDGDQETIAVDKWIIFQAPTHIAELVKVPCSPSNLCGGPGLKASSKLELPLSSIQAGGLGMISKRNSFCSFEF